MSGPDPNGEADAFTASAILLAAGYLVTPNRIRVWAHRGKVRRLGKDGHGRTLYAFADVWDAATGRKRIRV